MNYENLIKNWHQQATSDDFFSKYVFEYLAFIGFLKRIKFVNEDSDTNAVRRLKHDEEFKNVYLTQVENSPTLQEAWNLIKTELDTSPLHAISESTGEICSIWYWDCGHEFESKKEREVHECEKQGTIRDLSDWANMVEFWHSIRNNLFHGSKNPQDKRDKILIENGFKTLSPLVDFMVTTIR